VAERLPGVKSCRQAIYCLLKTQPKAGKILFAEAGSKCPVVAHKPETAVLNTSAYRASPQDC